MKSRPSPDHRATARDRDIAIRLTDVSKNYIIHHEKPTLVEQFTKHTQETFWALRHVNLIIRKGERVGIIGPNGSGKTTILKIIAGIATPTSGTVTTRGKIVSLIDLEAGFHPDLSGERNIHLNGMLLGMTRSDISGKLKRIISFADIRQFIDAPVYSYSDGMKLRLGLSIAIHADSDILLLDEALAAGDENFKKKIRIIFDDFIKQKKTIIQVSHWLNTQKEHCDRIIELERGTVINDGTTAIVDRYRKKHNLKAVRVYRTGVL